MSAIDIPEYRAFIAHGGHVVTRAMKTRIAHAIRFGSEEPSSLDLLYGWQFPDRTAVWTAGKHSGLMLPAFDSPFGAFIEIGVCAFTPTEALSTQPLTVWANGVRVAQLDVRFEAIFAFFVPPPDPTSPRVVLAFDHPSAARPLDILGQPDGREVAIAFETLRVLVLESPMPPRCDPPRSEYRATDTGDADLQRRRAEELTGLPVASLASAFTAIGINCELGFVQRELGTEPMDLLRFAGGIPRSLIQGIDCVFDGIDAAENIDTFTVDHAGGVPEWIVADRRYRLTMHTGRFGDEGASDAAHRAYRTRMRVLRHKFEQELRAAERVYVLSNHASDMTYAEAMAFLLALRRRGDVDLLWLTAADDSHPSGMVEQVHPHLWRAYVDRSDTSAPVTAPPIGSWLAILTNAWLLRHSA